jgi:hypothetical protein
MKRYVCVIFLVFLLCSCDTIHQESSKTDTKKSANSIFVISPYKYYGTWVFDDPRVSLVREPFVAGIPEMIDKLVKDIPNADQGFRLLFSASPFPGYTIKLTWVRGEGSGNWYFCEEYNAEGWLCPALFRYFDEAPKEIYGKAEKK